MVYRLFILWLQGFENAPCIVQQCIESWKRYNPSWKITLLHDKNLHKYMDVSIFKKGKFPLQKIVDIIRLSILKKYGGVWCSATLFCNQPLDSWVYDYIESEFFMCRRCSGDRYVSNIFMYASKNSELLNMLYNKTIFCYNTNIIHDDIFVLLYKTNRRFAQLWNHIPVFHLGEQGVYDYQIIPKKRRRAPFYKLNYNPTYTELVSSLLHKHDLTGFVQSVKTNLYVYNYKSTKPLTFKYF